MRISGQNFTEAEIVADMYAGVLEKAGYTPQVKLVGTRDVYMQTFPKSIDVVPEYVGGIVDFLTPQGRPEGADPDGVRPREGDRRGQAAAGQGRHHPARPVGGNRHQRLLRDQEVLRRRTTSPRSPTSRASSVVLAAAPDCKGRLDCEGGLRTTYGIKITKILPLGYASQQTYNSVIDGESQLGETSTTDGTLEQPGPRAADRRQARSSRPRTSCRRWGPTSSRPTRTWPTR